MDGLSGFIFMVNLEASQARMLRRYLMKKVPSLYKTKVQRLGRLAGFNFNGFSLIWGQVGRLAGGQRRTGSALSGGRFCQYKSRDEERSLRRGGRRILPDQSMDLSTPSNIYIWKLKCVCLILNK